MRTIIHPKYKAFTLIELLAIIAIISLLSAILFPVFGQARERARASSCLSNLKQQGIALQMYLDDYDNIVPPREYVITGDPNYDYQSFLSGKRKKGTSGANAVWYQEFSLLQPYLKSFQVRSCPSANILSIRNPGDVSPSGTPYGYGFNQSYLFPSSSPPFPNSTTIEKASETIFLADTAYVLNAATLQTWTGNWAPNVTYPTTHARHQGFAGVAWMDGHAKAMKVTMRVTPAFSVSQVAMWSKYNVGDILHPNYPKGSAGENYYYMLIKPTG